MFFYGRCTASKTRLSCASEVFIHHVASVKKLFKLGGMVGGAAWLKEGDYVKGAQSPGAVFIKLLRFTPKNTAKS